MRYRIAEPLKEIANRIAGGGMPADKKRSYRQDQKDSLKQAIHTCCHFALRSAVFNISGAFLVRRARLRDFTRKGIISFYCHALPPSVAIDLVFVRPHDFRLALISRFKHSQQRRAS